MKDKMKKLLLEKVQEKLAEDPAKEAPAQDAMPTEAEMADNAEVENQEVEQPELTPEEIAAQQEAEAAAMEPIDMIKVDKSIESLTVSEKHKRLKILRDFRSLLEETEKLSNILRSILSDESVGNDSNVSSNIKFLNRTRDILTGTHEKIEYYINNGFVEDSYDKILYTFVWLRSEIELISKLLSDSLKID